MGFTKSLFARAGSQAFQEIVDRLPKFSFASVREGNVMFTDGNLVVFGR